MAEYRIELGWKHAVVAGLNRMLGRYEFIDHPAYRFRKPRMSLGEFVSITEGYVAKYGDKYKDEINAKKTVVFMSQYYLFRKIESFTKGAASSVLDIGGFYCGAAREFIDRNPGSTVHAIDIPGVVDLNRDISGNGLTVDEGYPLEMLERMADAGMRFQFVTFTRTATLINVEQLREYLKVIAKIADNVLFLEVAIAATIPAISVDLRKVQGDSISLYNGMYLHNYGKLLEDVGFRVDELYWLNNKAFDQQFSPDHYFVVAWGSRN